MNQHLDLRRDHTGRTNRRRRPHPSLTIALRIAAATGWIVALACIYQSQP